MTLRALIVGIADYDSQAKLPGTLTDAQEIKLLLQTNEDGSKNFDCLCLDTKAQRITTSVLLPKLVSLLKEPADVALFYFSGHGLITFSGGAIAMQDSTTSNPGISMNDLIAMANQSNCGQVVIILDCCYSGKIGQLQSGTKETATLREGVSILAATRPYQVAKETNEGGIFTSLVREALKGGAADLKGAVNVASVYSYVDSSLSAWDQRPVFKSHVSSLTPLRSCTPSIAPSILKKIAEYFPTKDHKFPLDPTYEPAEPSCVPAHAVIFGHLQQMRAASLVKPDGEAHMYYAALNRKTCSLTPLGQFHWRLAKP